MAKKYLITESQYKEVLNQLNINESDMGGEDLFHGYPEPADQPGYALTDVTVEDGEAGQVLAIFWTEENTERIYKGRIEFDEVTELGFDPQQILNDYATNKEIPYEVDAAAWEMAEYTGEKNY